MIDNIIDEYTNELYKNEYLLFTDFISNNIDINIENIENDLIYLISDLRDIIKESNNILTNYNKKLNNTNIISKLSNTHNIKQANLLSSIIIYILSNRIKSKDNINKNIELLFNLFNEVSNSGLTKEKNILQPHPIKDIYIRQIRFDEELLSIIESNYPEYYLKVKGK